MRRLIIAIFSLCFAVWCGAPSVFAQVDDVPGSSDHPAVGRYEGARIGFYETKAYEELSLPFKALIPAIRMTLPHGRRSLPGNSPPFATRGRATVRSWR